MSSQTERIAAVLGAQVVAELPDTGGGAFGAARHSQLAATLQARLTPGHGRRPGRPTDARWAHRSKVPMSAETVAGLLRLAESVSTPERRVSPMQVAAQLLEDAVQRQTGD
jgi:hypothetical protein